MTSSASSGTGSFLKKFGIVFLVVAVVIAGVTYFRMSLQAEKPIRAAIDASFKAYVSAYTAGVISKTSSIKIQLAEQYADSSKVGEALPAGIFAFSPSVEGKASWVNDRTLEFVPSAPLKSGEKYEIEFKLGELLDEIPAHQESFSYEFRTVPQNYELELEGLEAYELRNQENQKLSGSISTADVAEDAEVEKLLRASQDGKELKVSWKHDKEGNSHQFVVENISRLEREGKVELEMDGNAIGVPLKSKEEVEVPSLSDFKLMSCKVVQHPSQYVTLRFSDPLDTRMRFDGLVRVGSLQSLRYQVNGNELRVYPPVRQNGEKEVVIDRGVKNLAGYNLKGNFSRKAVFEQVKPAVRLVGKGNILPSSEGFVFPFEAVNLKMVDVTILKIYENNVAQFFQVNQIGGNREMKRVGRPVLRKAVSLNTTGVTDLGKWNRFTLDLNELVNAERGAIYQVEIGFKQAYSTYFCGEEASDAETMTSTEDDIDWDESDEDSYWDDYGYYYGSGYNWRDRDDPCTPSYFMGRDKKVTRNILASDLGLIAKGAEKGEMLVVVTDLKTTSPMSGVEVEIYNYQQQYIGSATSDANGFARLSLDKKPYLLVAKSGAERGYLRLDDGSSLSLSNFNTGGQKVEKGLKGYIYGERGVWRPGDSLHISFVLEDQEKTLPENHPVVFELSNPIGQVTTKIIRSTSLNGFYNFSTATAEDDITGNWMAKVKVGGATFSKPLKIESIKPNRLKIKLDFGMEKITPKNNKLNSELEVKWLHGAIAPNLKAEFSVSLKAMPTKFEDYSEYSFDDQAKYFYGENQQVFSGKLDAEGKATINTTLETEAEPPGMLNATFTGRVYEESGNFSIDQFAIPFSPYQSYVGILPPKGDRARNMLLTDTLHTVSIVTVDSEGEPVSRNNIQLELYKLDWKWWWDSSEEYLSSYVGRYGRSPIKRGRISSSSGGRAEWQFRVDYPEWGRFYLRAKDPVSGHSSGKIIYIDWPGWAGDSQKNMPGGAAMLSFAPDKAKYTVGEKVNINIPGSGQGRALVSVENGSKVVDAWWIETNKGQNQISFEVTEEMSPNVFAHITLLQPHSQTTNDLPIRMYGVSPILVENPETKLLPEIEMPEVLEPEQTFKVKVSESNDKAMTYTLAIVDEGLLDLTRFPTPDPWNKFYAREALGVKTWDVYDEVMGAFGGKLERLLAIGGGGLNAKGAKNAKANRFKPVVIYKGPFQLEKGKTNEHELTMPAYVGSVRAMVVAGQDGAYGNAETASPVKQALMVLGTLPRVLGPEEIVELPVNVFAMNENLGNVEVTIETNEMLSLETNATKNLDFDKAGEKTIRFRMKTIPKLGVATVKITAKGGGKTATHEIEIDVRNPNPPMVKVMDELIEAGKSWESTFNLFGMEGTNKATLEVSNIPPINLGQRLKYLLNYPHGCIEQTTSSAFPQLYLANIMELDEATQAKTEKNIKAAIERIQSFQNRDGGLSYWPVRSTSDEWGTNYAYHFLLEAKQKGYNVPSELLNKIKRFQRKLARNWSPTNGKQNRGDLIQAYRLYTLAVAKSPEMGSMNRMREMGSLNNQVKWRLAAAYYIAGQKEAGDNLVQNANKQVQSYQELSYTYGSTLRDQAMILETICLMGDRKQGVDLLKDISAGLSEQNNWLSTQTTAYCLIAVSKFAADSESGDLTFKYTLNGESEVNATTGLPLVQKGLTINKAGSNQLKITNESNGVMFARIIVEGTPARGTEKASQRNLNMTVNYVDKEGLPVDIENLAQGQDFFAEVTVSNPGTRGDYKEMALTQVFPSGWEIFNTRLFANSFTPGSKVDKPAYIDIRDDRVYMYFDLKSGEKKTFKVMLNSSFAGEFYLPAVQCEAMYDRTINANTIGQSVMVSGLVEQ